MLTACITGIASLSSLLYGYVFWGENPEPAAWLGGGIIVFGGMLLIRSRRHLVEHAEKD